MINKSDATIGPEQDDAYDGVGLRELSPTYNFGYLLRRTSPGAIGQLVIRWASSFLVFMIAASAARLPESVDEWPDHEGVFVFGLAYFLVLRVLELSGAYHSRPALTIIRRFREQLKQERGKQSR